MVIGSESWTLTVYRDAQAASKAAADVVAETVLNKPDAAMVFPTGSTPLGMFDVLAARAAHGEIDFSRIAVFCLDEYVGVTVDDPMSFSRWLWDALLNRIGLRPDQVTMLPVTANDLVSAAAEFDTAVATRGGIDLAILGLGPNGHIGYNEPGSSASSRTRVIRLTPESREQASAYWQGALQIPDLAMTMGVGTLLEAKRVLLLVTGEEKADVLRQTLAGPTSATVPASWLRSAGPRLTIITDEAAASHLPAKQQPASGTPGDPGGDIRA